MIQALLMAAAVQAAPCPDLLVLSETGEKQIAFWLDGTAKDAGYSYNWVVSAGVIENGQGTPKIDVMVEQGVFVTASVEVGGVAKGCESFISASDEILPPE